MEWWLALAIIFGSLVVLMTTGMPVAFCFMLVNVVGVFIFWGGTVGLRQLGLSIFSSVSTFAFLPVPLFILMGEVMFRSGLGLSMVDTLDKWMGRLPGRLGLLAVASGTLFSTMSGSTIGATAMLGSVLSPEMEKRGYKKPMSIGPIMGSGGLAMIIPPSALAVILACLAEISVAKILISGIIPGLIIACFYSTYIIGRCYFQRSIAPSYALTPTPLSEKIKLTVKHVLPLGFIIFMVLGLIFLGVTTPSEAAATGTLSCFILAALYGRLNWEVVKKSIIDTMMITGMIFLIIAGAFAFSQILVFSGIKQGILGFVASMPLTPLMIIMALQVGAWALGTMMSSTPIMMIVIPIYMPIVYAMGFDPIWFGLILLINLEMSQTTPPFGVLLFTMKGVAPPDTTMGDIIRAGLPFLVCDLATMILVIAFPMLALWLPNLM